MSGPPTSTVVNPIYIIKYNELFERNEVLTTFVDIDMSTTTIHLFLDALNIISFYKRQNLLNQKMLETNAKFQNTNLNNVDINR